MLLQILITIFAAFAISRSYLRFRKNTESLWEFALWIVIWTSIAVVVWFPSVTVIPKKILGVGRGIDALVYISIVFLFYSVYRIYAKIEKTEQDVTKLTREMALKGRKGR